MALVFELKMYPTIWYTYNPDRNWPSLSSAPGFGPEASKLAVFARESSEISTGGFIGGCSGKILPREKTRSWCRSTNT